MGSTSHTGVLPFTSFDRKRLTLKKSVLLDSNEVNGNSFLHFTFNGHLDVASCKLVINQWQDLYSRFPEKSFVHIWKCSSMTSFDHLAKKDWLQQLKTSKSQTKKNSSGS